jgi:uncharacterized protein (TIGR02466 family)
MIIIPIFPEAVVYSTILDIDSDNILNYCKNLNFNYTKSSLRKEGDCCISDKFNVFDDLNQLQNKIEEHIKNYLYKVMSYKMDFKFVNSWATKANVNGFSPRHFHSNTFLTGVYYPKGHKEYKIKFYKKNESFWNIEVDNYNDFNGITMTYIIEKDSTLLLFPSDVGHSIETNSSNTDRYSIAFNINPKGFIGSSDSRVFF